MVPWTREEESALAAAVNKYRKGNWRRMIEDPDFSQVLGGRSTKSLNDKWKRMVVTNKFVGAGPNDEAYAYPVDIFTSLKDTGLLKRLKAERGSECEEDVAELAKLAARKNIVPGNFTEVSVTLKKLMQDAISHGNSAIAVKAIQAIGNLARGLRTHFSCISVLMLTFLLRNLEVEEPTVTNALTQTLQAMYQAGCLSLIDIIEDVKRAVKNKVPRVRSLTLNWVTFCLEISNKAPTIEEYQKCLALCRECLDDRTPEVKVAAFSLLRALVKGAANLKAEAKTTAAEAKAAAVEAKAAAAEALKAAKEALAFAAKIKITQESLEKKFETLDDIKSVDLKPSIGITEALRLQMEVQKCLHEQLELQIEEQQKLQENKKSSSSPSPDQKLQMGSSRKDESESGCGSSRKRVRED